MTSVVTRTGDDGKTGLYGGERVSKSSVRVSAYGTVDELNAAIGVVLSSHTLPSAARTQLSRLQHLLFHLGADLATPLLSKAKTHRVAEAHVTELEGWITGIESALPPQTSFILPGGSAESSLIHLARTVCRRAERDVVHLSTLEDVSRHAVIFLNRLSDYLFVLARHVNMTLGIPDAVVQYDPGS